MAIRYWVSLLTDNWDSMSNWSVFSGGGGGASVPGLSDTAIFDSSGPGSCLIDTTVALESLLVETGYTGTISQGSYPISVSTDSSLRSCSFLGGNAPLSLNNAYLHGMDFTSTSSVLTVAGGFYFKEDPPIPVPPQVVLDEFTLDSQNITDKYVVLSDQPLGSTALNVVGGGAQNFGTDYTVSGFFLSWAGLALDGILEPGDILRAMYTDQGSVSGSSFFHNDGSALFKTSGNWTYMGGIRFNNLHIQDDGGAIRIDSSCFVERSLFLESGYIARDLDATVHVLRDMTCYEGFGQTGTGCQILFDGTGRQSLVYSGGLLPTIMVDKQVTDHIRCYGQSPVLIDGNLVIQDGTFNTNGLDLQVGEIS